MLSWLDYLPASEFIRSHINSPVLPSHVRSLCNIIYSGSPKYDNTPNEVCLHTCISSFIIQELVPAYRLDYRLWIYDLGGNVQGRWDLRYCKPRWGRSYIYLSLCNWSSIKNSEGLSGNHDTCIIQRALRFSHYFQDVLTTPFFTNDISLALSNEDPVFPHCLALYFMSVNKFF